MARNRQPALPLTGLLCLTLTAACPQNASPYNPAEKTVLQIITRDTTTHTVCYLPGSFLFGWKDPNAGHYVLLKAGPVNHIIREATGQVFRVVNGPKGPRLLRIDSTRHAGDNFRLMGFQRRDTLYTLGGYGFWKTRENLARYRPDQHRWEFMPTVNPMPVTHWYHQYRPEEDALYYFGGTAREELNQIPNPFQDSVRRYNFATRQWTTLGHLHPDFAHLTKQWTVEPPRELTQTPFGILDITSYPVAISLHQNRVSRIKAATADSLYRILPKVTHDMKTGDLVTLYLSDTLHCISIVRDSVKHQALRITSQDFDGSTAKPLYIPIRTASDRTFRRSIMALLLVASVLAAFLLLRGRHIRIRTETITYSSGTDISEADRSSSNTTPSQTDPLTTDTNAITRFLDTLPPAERELLQRLFILSLQGRMMDVETCNRALGVARKDETIRKTRRSQAITTLNETYSLTLRQEGELVLRVKNPDDKRSYHYTLSTAGLQVLKAGMPDR